MGNEHIHAHIRQLVEPHVGKLLDAFDNEVPYLIKEVHNFKDYYGDKTSVFMHDCLRTLFINTFNNVIGKTFGFISNSTLDTRKEQKKYANFLAKDLINDLAKDDLARRRIINDYLKLLGNEEVKNG